MNTNGNFRDHLSSIIAGDDLNQSEMYQMMDTILSGTLTDAQIGAFMAALAAKGETFSELAGAAQAMRKKALRIQTTAATVVDTCGTGGDGTHSFNISTNSGR